jgi:hypothetical protein
MLLSLLQISNVVTLAAALATSLK